MNVLPIAVFPAGPHERPVERRFEGRLSRGQAEGIEYAFDRRDTDEGTAQHRRRVKGVKCFDRISDRRERYQDCPGGGIQLVGYAGDGEQRVSGCGGDSDDRIAGDTGNDIPLRGGGRCIDKAFEGGQVIAGGARGEGRQPTA